MDYVGTKARVKFNGHCLKQEKITFNHRKMLNIYIVYKIGKSVNISSYATLENFLFAAVKLMKYANVYLYKYSGYAYPLCLGNISKDWSIDDMKNAGLKGYIYNFNVYYDAI